MCLKGCPFRSYLPYILRKNTGYVSKRTSFKTHILFDLTSLGVYNIYPFSVFGSGCSQILPSLFKNYTKIIKLTTLDTEHTNGLGAYLEEQSSLAGHLPSPSRCEPYTDSLNDSFIIITHFMSHTLLPRYLKIILLCSTLRLIEELHLLVQGQAFGAGEVGRHQVVALATLGCLRSAGVQSLVGRSSEI